MKRITFKRFYIFSVLVVILASLYPLYMAVNVVADMVRYGTVLEENFPKYIIPYAPISLSVVVGVVLMPIMIRCIKGFALLAASGVSVGVFFVSELLLESRVIVTSTVQTTLESWQMFMCYVPPTQTETRTWTAVDVLMGEYSPAFKIHFYLISIVLILSLLNSFYGFAQVINGHDKKRVKALVLQTISSVIFLGLCIFACFTAFFRTGELLVSAVSAVLMTIFFVIFGVTMGIYVGSLTLGRKRLLAVWVPAGVASAVTLIMYVGEMILLSGHLYQFGTGILFEGLGGLVLAPFDIGVILFSGVITAGILILLLKKESENL